MPQQHTSLCNVWLVICFVGQSLNKCLLQDLANEVGVRSRYTFRERCTLLAGYAVLLVQTLHMTIMNTLVDISSRPATRIRFLSHIEVAIYDETPMPMRDTSHRQYVLGSRLSS